MIKYYAYYNHGGYKDFYLGSSEDTDFSRYFLPLLSVYENDVSMTEKVNEWKKLPTIINLSTETNEYNYPKQARVMMSHAGYKLQYRIIDNRGVLALRDIGGNKDSYGRSCPFVMMMVADTEEDKQALRKICSFAWKNTGKVEAILKNLFVNDFEVNGLRFDLGRLNDSVLQIISSTEDLIDENPHNRPVVFFIVPSDIRFVTAFEEQQISKDDVSIAYSSDSTKFYRYSPSQQTYYGPSGSIPTPNNPPQDRYKNKDVDTEKRHSLRKTLGFAKAEDLEDLSNTVKNLSRQIEILENRIKALESK